MKLNKFNILLSNIVASFLLTSCTAWLTAEQPDVTKLEDFYISADAATQNATACYVPLQWEYGNTYFPEWFIGDVMSDDASKGGGSLNDMADAYNMEMWKTISDNTLLHDYWRAQFLGVSRCNLALAYIPNMKTDTLFSPELKHRLIAEARFLRGYYYFRLVRVFGGVPLVDHVISGDNEWNIPRATAKEIYAFILDDFKYAADSLWLKSEYESADLGRATKGAAQAMLAKINLYLASEGNATNRADGKDAAYYYQQASDWAGKVIESDEYDLANAYADNFTLEGENGIESVFEIQYIGNEGDGTGDYGAGQGGLGFTRGTFTMVLTRSRSSVINTLGDGWGFNHPTANLYNEYEPGDIRRDVTIYVPKDGDLTSPAEETYLGNANISRKYGLYNTVYTAADAATCVTIYKLGHATRGPINNKQIRYADVLLMKAEAMIGLGLSGDTYINEVRSRVGLPAVNGANMSTLRHERRCELAMEGHRWFDLCRWGIAYETITAFQAGETKLYQDQVSETGFIKGKHELLPIPLKEMELNHAMDQNFGY